MSSFVPRATPPALADPDPSKHVKYTLGMVLGVDDFTQEFAYLAGRDEWLTRDLLGYGTAAGLRVNLELEEGGPQVLVTPGVAVSPRGRLIRVAPAQCADLNLWLASRREELAQRLGNVAGNRAQLRLYVVLSYRDCATDLVPIPGEPCRSQEETLAPSRLADDFRLELRLDAPDQREEDALRDFVEWLSQVEVTDESNTTSSLEALEQAIRDAARLNETQPASPPDFLHGSPPEALRIHPSMAYEYLRAAFRLWTTELRPRWQSRRAQGGGSDGLLASSAEDDGVLLADLSFPVARAAAHALWQVEDANSVEIHEERRPYLVHLRMLQELVVSGRRAGGGATSAGASVGPGFTVTAEQSFGLPPSAGRRFDYARADHTHGTPPAPVLGGDVTGNVGLTTVAAIRNREVDATAPAENQVLTFKNGKWRAAAPTAAAQSGTGPSPANSVTPETAYGLPSKIGTSTEYARADHSHGTPGFAQMIGDVSGTTATSKVQAIQNVLVSATRPTGGQVLMFDAGASLWKPAFPDAPPPAQTNVVTRPEGQPAYRIVAAGLVPAVEGEGRNTYNNLRVTRVGAGVVGLTFDGYKPPAAASPTQQYIVKALPVAPPDSEITSPTVVFLRFADAESGFFLLVNNEGTPIDDRLMAALSLMVEVSEYDLPLITRADAAKTKESEVKSSSGVAKTKETKESEKVAKEKDTKESEKAVKDTKESEKAASKETKDTKEQEKAAKEKDTKESEKAVKDTKEQEKASKETKDTKEKDTKESKDTKDTKEKDTKESKDTKDTKEKDTKESKDTKDSKEKDTKESKDKDTKESKDKDTKESKDKETKESKEKETKETKDTKDTKDTKEKDTKESKDKDTKETKEKETKERKDTKELEKATKEEMALKEKDRDQANLPNTTEFAAFTASDASLSVSGLEPPADEAAGRAFIREDERPAVGRQALELADKEPDKQPEAAVVDKQAETVN